MLSKKDNKMTEHFEIQINISIYISFQLLCFKNTTHIKKYMKTEALSNAFQIFISSSKIVFHTQVNAHRCVTRKT